MKDIFIFSFYISHILLVVKSDSISVNNTLKCYQCEMQGRDPSAKCNEEDLKTCPNDYAADRCLTNVQRNGTFYHIIRKCALAPCDLQGIQNELLRLSDKCPRDRESYSCFTCCETDGCNRLNSSTTLSSSPHFFLLSLFSLISYSTFHLNLF